MIQTITKKKRSKPIARPKSLPIVIDQIYDRRDAAAVVGCSVITLIRAYDAGHLQAYRVGRYVKHSGQHLLKWLEAGGKTGWAKKGGEQGG